MKQLFIVKRAAALNGGASTPKDLSGMAEGSIGFYHLDTPGSWLSAAATKDFAIVYGRGANSPAIVFPEVNFATLSKVLTEPAEGVIYTSSVTIGTGAATGGENYTLVLSKLGVHFNERSNYTATEFIPINSTKTLKDVALSLAKQLASKAKFDNLQLTVDIDGEDPETADLSDVTAGVITVTATDNGAYKLQGGDALMGITVTETSAEKNIGDKAYVEDLASRCAQNRGFSDTYADGVSTIPGYPMEVEDTTDGDDSDWYNIITLRFAVPRKSAKTRDEVVNQLVHIAIPADNAGLSTIKTILGVS